MALADVSCGDSPVSDAQEPDQTETDPRFPSGPWIGFFLQTLPALGRQWMELRLKFSKGSLSGEGRDIVGAFSVRGRYELVNGSCYWTKTYHGKHDVAYSGFNEGKGIWGKWEIPPSPPLEIRLHGGFHIWPEGMRDPTGNALEASADLPVEEPVSPRRIAEPVRL
jgi:hypothetical protein